MCTYILQPEAPANENDTFKIDYSVRSGVDLYFVTINQPAAATNSSTRRLEAANLKNLTTLYTDYAQANYKVAEIPVENPNLLYASFKGSNDVVMYVLGKNDTAPASVTLNITATIAYVDTGSSSNSTSNTTDGGNSSSGSNTTSNTTDNGSQSSEEEDNHYRASIIIFVSLLGVLACAGLCMWCVVHQQENMFDYTIEKKRE